MDNNNNTNVNAQIQLLASIVPSFHVVRNNDALVHSTRNNKHSNATPENKLQSHLFTDTPNLQNEIATTTTKTNNKETTTASQKQQMTSNTSSELHNNATHTNSYESKYGMGQKTHNNNNNNNNNSSSNNKKPFHSQQSQSQSRKIDEKHVDSVQRRHTDFAVNTKSNNNNAKKDNHTNSKLEGSKESSNNTSNSSVLQAKDKEDNKSTSIPTHCAECKRLKEAEELRVDPRDRRYYCYSCWARMGYNYCIKCNEFHHGKRELYGKDKGQFLCSNCNRRRAREMNDSAKRENKHEKDEVERQNSQVSNKKNNSISSNSNSNSKPEASSSSSSSLTKVHAGGLGSGSNSGNNRSETRTVNRQAGKKAPSPSSSLSSSVGVNKHDSSKEKVFKNENEDNKNVESRQFNEENVEYATKETSKLLTSESQQNDKSNPESNAIGDKTNNKHELSNLSASRSNIHSTHNHETPIKRSHEGNVVDKSSSDTFLSIAEPVASIESYKSEHSTSLRPSEDKSKSDQVSTNTGTGTGSKINMKCNVQSVERFDDKYTAQDEERDAEFLQALKEDYVQECVDHEEFENSYDKTKNAQVKLSSAKIVDEKSSKDESAKSNKNSASEDEGKKQPKYQEKKSGGCINQ